MKNLIMGLTNIATVILFFSNSAQVKQNIDGLWEGTVKFPGIETKIVFRIKTLPDGKLAAEMLKPDEHDNVITANYIAVEDSGLFIEVESIKGVFRGRVKISEEIIVGEWQEGRWLQRLVLKKVLKVSKPSRPQTPVPPFPYNIKEVNFVNKKENAVLAGTLTWPYKNFSGPAVILISGGGAQSEK